MWVVPSPKGILKIDGDGVAVICTMAGKDDCHVRVLGGWGQWGWGR